VDVKERIFRYGLAGLFATAVYFGAVAILVDLVTMDPVPAAAAATVIVTLVSYAVNRLWVFDTNRSHVSAFTRFVAASVLSVAINTGLMYLSVRVLGWPYLSGVALASVIVPPANFAINYLWCFRGAS
jgi:putative flippase GtrA